MLFVNFLKKNAEAGQAFFKKLLLVQSSNAADRMKSLIWPLLRKRNRMYETTSCFLRSHLG